MKTSHKIPLIASLFIAVCFLSFSWIEYRQNRNEIYRSTENYISDTANLLSNITSEWLNTRLSFIDMMGELISEDFEPNRVNKILSSPLLDKYFQSFFGVIEENTKSVDNIFSALPNWKNKEREWYGIAVSSEKASLTEPYLDETNKKLTISVVSKISKNGETIATFGGDIHLDTIADLINQFTMNNMAYFFLLDKNGNIISHPIPNYYQVNISTLILGKSLQIKEDIQEAISQDKEVLVSFYRINNLPNKEWYIGAVVNKNMAFAKINSMARKNIILAIIISLFASMSLYFIMRLILIDPVEKLTIAADEISKGAINIDLEGVDRKDEIGMLANAIKRMQKSLRMAMSRLDKNKNNPY